MKVSVIGEDSSNLSIEIEGEGHTLCNLLRHKLWELGVDSCGYNLKHPIISSPVLSVESSKTKPRKAIASGIDEIRKNIKTIRNELKKIK